MKQAEIVGRIAFFLLACATGCATPNASHSTERLRSQGGACADTDIGGSRFAPPPMNNMWTNVKACARTGSPFTTFDSDTPMLITTLDGQTFEEADLGNWLITVTAPDGTVILHQQPEHSVPQVNSASCTSTGCRKTGFAVSRLSAAWGPGTYKVNYLLTFDTRQSANLTITLEGKPPATPPRSIPSSGVALASATVPEPSSDVAGPAVMASRPPKKAWVAGVAQAYKNGCMTNLQTKYGATRTPDQLKYACDCITWNLQERYSITELGTPEAVKAVGEISAGCKKNRPAALGPDPG